MATDKVKTHYFGHGNNYKRRGGLGDESGWMRAFPHQHSAFLSTFLSLILPLSPSSSARWRKKMGWSRAVMAARLPGLAKREEWVWETILRPFLIWMLPGFPLAAVGDDSLLTKSPAHQCSDWSCTHTNWVCNGAKRQTCGLMRWWGPQRCPALQPSLAFPSALQDPDHSMREGELLA